MLPVILLVILSAGQLVHTSSSYPRLPTFARPIHYDLYLKPDLNTFVFEGTVKIDVKIENSTDHLQLHSAELDILEITIISSESGGKKDLIYHTDQGHQFLTINLTSFYTKDEELTIRIVYKGAISDKLHGLYRSSYKQQNETKYLISTQLESTYARFAFPCWDEPVFKANFTISLDVESKYTAISNMPESDVREKDGRKVVKFETTLPMSSYLVAFAVGELEFLEETTPQGTRVRVYTTPGKTNLAKMALKVHTKALMYNSDLFDYPYPLKKCDAIALPDFSLGAMENWGLITYRESFLLMDEETTPIFLVDKLVTIIGHEVGHFWFGNLVTMKWWDNLWLKEGFATFLQYLFSADNYPKYRAWDEFLGSDIDVARDLDSLEHSHPIDVPIDNPAELELIYDGVCYEKSGAIIRMLYLYLGREKFLTGLRAYIRKHKYSNAESDDLWNAFSEVVERDVKTLMSGWTKLIGYPVVIVALTNASKPTLELSQRKFLASGIAVQSESVWQIPLILEISNDGQKRVNTTLWTTKTGIFHDPSLTASDYIQLNPTTSGFFHVKYDGPVLFKNLLKAYDNNSMGHQNRYTLLIDTYYLVTAGMSEIDDLLDLIMNSSNENFALVLSLIKSTVTSIQMWIEQSGNLSVLDRFNSFVQRTFTEASELIGWTRSAAEDSEVLYVRESLKNIMVTVSDEKTLAESKSRFASGLYAPELKPVVYKVIAKDGIAGFRTILRLFEECTVAEEKRTLRMALGFVTDKEALTELLEYILIKDNVRSQDLFHIVASLGCTPTGQQMGWQFVKDNFKDLQSRYESATSYNVINGIAKLLGATSDVSIMSEVTALFTRKEAKQIHRSLGELEERIGIHSRQWILHGQNLVKWLDRNGF